jgi:VanZ family protein
LETSPTVPPLLRIAWLVALVLVVVGSLLPPSSAPMEELARLPVSDKVEHVAGYFVLAFLPALHESRRRALQLAAAAVALGVLLEFIQPSFSRDFEVGDMVADAVGAGLGLAVGRIAALRLWSRGSRALR